MTLLNFTDFFADTPELAPWHADLARAIDQKYHARPHGDEARWAAAVAALPATSGTPTFDQATVATGPNLMRTADLHASFGELEPWRKGPFRFGTLEIDAEWRSDLKWRRLAPHLKSLPGRRVIDIGAGNGYFLYRCLGAGADLAIGVDPTRLFLWQFEAFRRALPSHRAHLLPLASEDLPPIGSFDTAFTMGVIYHRRDPVAHLREVAAQLRPGGELVVESLIVQEDGDTALVPHTRYARMRNVWEIPSTARLARQLGEAGLSGIQVVDVTPTTPEEQRPTAFMGFESLQHCLDPENPSRTVEGYPAPVRAILIASRP